MGWDLYGHTRLVAYPVPDVSLYSTMIQACAHGAHPSHVPQRFVVVLARAFACTGADDTVVRKFGRRQLARRECGAVAAHLSRLARRREEARRPREGEVDVGQDVVLARAFACTGADDTVVRKFGRRQLVIVGHLDEVARRREEARRPREGEVDVGQDDCGRRRVDSERDDSGLYRSAS
jgi:predicted alpha/beta-hydrolase family hydrolase